MIDMFKDLWDAMTPEQKRGIAWIAIKDDRVLGECSENQMERIAIAAVNAFAKHNSENYEEYRENVMEFTKGMAKGLLDGGIDYYLSDPIE